MFADDIVNNKPAFKHPVLFNAPDSLLVPTLPDTGQFFNPVLLLGCQMNFMIHKRIGFGENYFLCFCCR